MLAGVNLREPGAGFIRLEFIITAGYYYSLRFCRRCYDSAAAARPPPPLLPLSRFRRPHRSSFRAAATRHHIRPSCPPLGFSPPPAWAFCRASLGCCLGMFAGLILPLISFAFALIVYYTIPLLLYIQLPACFISTTTGPGAWASLPGRAGAGPGFRAAGRAGCCRGIIIAFSSLLFATLALS